MAWLASKPFTLSPLYLFHWNYFSFEVFACDSAIFARYGSSLSLNSLYLLSNLTLCDRWCLFPWRCLYYFNLKTREWMVSLSWLSSNFNKTMDMLLKRKITEATGELISTNTSYGRWFNRLQQDMHQYVIVLSSTRNKLSKVCQSLMETKILLSWVIWKQSKTRQQS